MTRQPIEDQTRRSYSYTFRPSEPAFDGDDEPGFDVVFIEGDREVYVSWAPTTAAAQNLLAQLRK